MSIKYGLKHGFRSGLEDSVALQLIDLKIKVEYEQHKIKYIVPARVHTYTPDFLIKGKLGQFFVETKGRFVLEDRKKHLRILEEYPDLDIRFVFSNSKNKISKGSKTTYADWCISKGFKFANKVIPEEWLIEVGAL